MQWAAMCCADSASALPKGSVPGRRTCQSVVLRGCRRSVMPVLSVSNVVTVSCVAEVTIDMCVCPSVSPRFMARAVTVPLV